MKPQFHFLIVLIAILYNISSYAQPANDLCGAAQPITVGVGACNSVLFTNVLATNTGNPATTPACWLPNSMSHTVWFSFIATKADIEISTNFAGTLANTQLAVYSGTCGALTQIGCQEDVNTGTGLFHTDVILHGLTVGNTYYILVDGNGNTTGTFGVCAQESMPVGPPQPLQDCVSSQNLCNLSNIVVPNGPGGVGLNVEFPSCFGAPGERSSGWYSFTAATNGNLCFALTPNSPIDYDFAVYNTTNSCPGTELVCNWEPESGAGITGLGCGGIQCNTCLPVTAGQTYSILIDRFTADSAAGFSLSFAGTTAAFASPNPTFTNDSVCVGTSTQFTNTTNGNFTYSWNFGDGFTSSLENPTHTYASIGTYNVTLLVTAVPGGCQNSITKSVIVRAPATVDAGTGGNVCSGNCVTLSGSVTNASGSSGTKTFSNNTVFAIPDGSFIGVSSPINVSGILPAIIGAGTIVSVCVNLNHTWDSDLDIFLQCPNGTMIELSTDNGNIGQNYTGTCFTPTAVIPITTGVAPFNGTYAPEQSFALLNGCSANGTWNLFVQDDVGGDFGTINSWTLVLNNTIPAFTWSPTTGMSNANTLTPTVCPTVTTTYTLTANSGGGCPVTDQVTVTVGSGSTAAISYPSASFCTASPAQTVTLTGTGAFTGGVYSAPAGLTINTANGTITPASSTPGPYTVTYTIPPVGSCPAVTATTSITIGIQPNAGTDGGTVICSSNTSPISLFGLITGEQAGGVWTQDTGSGGIFNPTTGTFTPTAGATTATFLYTISGTAPCVTDTSQATVTIHPQPNAGTSGGTAICSSSTAAINLAALLTGAQPGGTWTRSSGSGGTFNAASGTFTPTAGTTTSIFTYSLAATSPCIPSVGTVTITINPIGTPIINCGVSTASSVQFNWTAVTGATGYTISYQVNANPIVNIGAIGNILTYSVNGLLPGDTVTISVTPTGTGTCFVTATQSCTATTCTPPVPSINYTGSPFCKSLTLAQPATLTGSGSYMGGTYSSATGLTMNPTTGSITPATSTPGNYTITYTLTGVGGCPTVTATASVTITDIPAIPMFTLIQPTCTTATGTLTITGTTGLTYSFDGSTYTATLIYSGLAAGSTHTVTAKNATGCISLVANVVFNAQPPTPAAPTFTVTQPTCTTATGTITITAATGMTYSFDGSAYTTNLIYNGLAAGSSHTITAKNTDGCISAIANTTINTQPTSPAAPVLTVTQPTCTIATGTIIITGTAGFMYSFDGGTYTAALTYNGLTAGSTHNVIAKNTDGCTSLPTTITLITQPVTPAIPTIVTSQPDCTTATGTITITAITGLTYSFDNGVYSPTLVYSGLPQSTSHTVTAMNADGCISAVANSTINTQPATPAAPILIITQPTCTTATGTITITPVTGMTYSFDGGAYSATLIYTGLAAGLTHTVTAKNATGCNSSPASASIAAQPLTPAVPILIPTDPTCLIPTGTVTITPVPGMTYSFDGGTYTTTLAYSGLPAGSTHTVTAQNTDGCISAIANITLNTPIGQPASPLLIPTHPTCTIATGNINIVGTPGITYSFDNGPYVTTLIYSALVAGSSHTVTAKTAAGCISAVATMVLNTQPASPILPIATMIQPDCTTATGTITITAVPGLTYSFDGSSYTSTVIYNSLLAGSSHTIIAQNSDGCLSPPATITLNTQPLTPTAPMLSAIQPTCTSAVGSILITPVSGMLYSLDGGVYSTALTYGGIVAGSTHNVTIKNAAGCISAPTAITLAPQPATPALPILSIIQPTCTTATGSVTITALTGIMFSFDGGAYSSTLSYSGLPSGSTHTVIAKNTDGCVSASVPITLNTQPVTPVVPTAVITAPTCSATTGSLAINGIVGMTYSFDNGVYTSTLIYNGLAAGSIHTVTVKNAVGCISSAASFTIPVQPPTPAAPILTAVQPTCTVATGSISITGITGTTYSFDGGTYSATLLYSGLAAGSTHTVTAKNTVGCISAATTIIINTQPVTPAAPILNAIHPTCTQALGVIIITAIPGMTYSFDGGTYSTVLIYTGLAAGSSHTVTAKNTAGCTSVGTTITLLAQPPTPVLPIASLLQPNCTIATGTLTITGIAGMTYSFDNGPYNTTLVYPGLAAGSNHNVRAKNTAGCISAAATFTINAQPITPVVIASPGLQTICSGNTTAITLSAIPGTTFSWTVVQTNVTGGASGSGSTIAQTLTAAGNVSGEAVYTITPFANGCTGLPITVVVKVNARPVAIASPMLQTLCSGERTDIALSPPIADNTTFQWTVVQNGVSGASSGNGNHITQILTATGLLPGAVIYTVVPVRNGCAGAAVTVTITVNPLPLVIATGTTSACDGEIVNIPLSANIAGTTYAWTVVQNGVSGAVAGSGNTINQLLNTTETTIGTVVYTIIPTLNGCIGNAFVITVRVNPLPIPKLIDGIVCVEADSGNTIKTYTLNAGLNNSTYSFVWSLDGSPISGAISNTYEAGLPGNYEVIATNRVTGCVSTPVSAAIIAAYVGQNMYASVSDAFTQNATIIVQVPIGTGPFLYRIDHGAWQSSNVFMGMTGGPHTVFVSDVNGCTDLSQEVFVIDYPKFFTPNSDGYNDYWNIDDLSGQSGSRIFIFDRYGKLIKEISPAGIGWDGTLNGHPLPGTDYWFTVDYIETGIPKIFKAHFSLKR